MDARGQAQAEGYMATGIRLGERDLEIMGKASLGLISEDEADRLLIKEALKEAGYAGGRVQRP